MKKALLFGPIICVQYYLQPSGKFVIRMSPEGTPRGCTEMINSIYIYILHIEYAYIYIHILILFMNSYVVAG